MCHTELNHTFFFKIPFNLKTKHFQVFIYTNTSLCCKAAVYFVPFQHPTSNYSILSDNGNIFVFINTFRLQKNFNPMMPKRVPL